MADVQFPKAIEGPPCKRCGGILRRRSKTRKFGQCVKCHSDWQKRNPNIAYAAARAWRKRNPEYDRARLGMPKPTRPEPESCECCGIHTSKLTYRLNLDHDHVTGEFRGWLCSICNSAIGLLGDNLDGIRKAINYLQRVTIE